MLHMKYALAALTVFASLVVSTTFVQAQNSLTIGSDLDLLEGTLTSTLDVTMDSTLVRHAVSLAISYDDSLATLSSVDIAGTASDGALWSAGTICNDIGDNAGACTAEGGVIWSIILGLDSAAMPDPTFNTGSALPAGNGTVVAELDFDTSGMSGGDVVDVEFQDGLDIFGVVGKNAIVNEGTGVSAPDLGLNNGQISIEEPGGQFRRADVDGSGGVTINDPIVNLTFQFLGGVTPLCLDAFDTDDSGNISVNDPIVSLTFQFLGGVTIAPPGTMDCGPDPTGDIGAGLDCETYPDPDAGASADC